MALCMHEMDMSGTGVDVGDSKGVEGDYTRRIGIGRP